MINNKKMLKVVIMILVVILVLIAGVTIHQKQAKKHNATAVVMVGFPKSMSGGLQQQLGEAFKYKSYLDKGDELVKEGKIDEAIKNYKTAFSLAGISGAKAVAIIAISDAYEKKMDYKKALEFVIIDRDKYVNDWAKEPVIERAKYLEYALKGEYELAVEHAQKALEADMKLFNRKQPREDYLQRLNGLKSAKDYILSLKKQ